MLHALLLSALVFAGYLFLAARSPAWVALVLGAGYFLATVTPGYVVWLTPELFNLATVTLAYFCWLYKEVAPPTLPRGLRWLRTHWSDVAAIVLLAMASFSKPPNAALIGPIVLLKWWRRGMDVGLPSSARHSRRCFAGFFLGNLASTGDLNFQGGERRTLLRGVPVHGPDDGLRSRAWTARPTRSSPTSCSTRSVFWSRLGWNVVYFFVGRHSGMLPYFFPGLLALALFLWPRTRRLGWQWLVFAAVVGETLLQLVWLPYTYYGGPGVLGSRYYMNIYGLQLFLLPAVASLGPGAGAVVHRVPVHREDHAEPVLLLVPSPRAREGGTAAAAADRADAGERPADQHPGRSSAPAVRPRARDSRSTSSTTTRIRATTTAFWIRGRSRADLLFKTPEAVRSLKLTVENGPFPTLVTLTRGRPARRGRARAGTSRRCCRCRSGPGSRIRARASGW